MPSNYSNFDKIDELKRKVSTLEWDLAFIRNDNLKSLKIQMLKSYKGELNRLLYPKEAA